MIQVLDFCIEPIEQRYSILWADWFSEAYERNGFSFWVMNGEPPVNQMDKGEFLNPFDTWRWKFPQLQRAIDILKECKRDRTYVCFLHDAWFPGIESLRYAATFAGINLKIVGFWHAGSYLSNDLLGMKGLNKYFWGSECSWFDLCDAVCVGSQYHKERILAALGSKDTDADKVHVTGYPIEVPKFPLEIYNRENWIVFPHRIAEDKHPEIFDRLASMPAYQGWSFLKTKELTRTKEEYYKMLAKAKIVISTATMETFGIATVEAVELGCWPVVPDALSYKELFTPGVRYNPESFESLDQKLTEVMDSGKDDGCLFPFGKSGKFNQKNITDKICGIIKKVGNG